MRRFRSVRDAEAAGIAVVYQELSLVAPLTVAENIVLGHEPRRFGVGRSPSRCATARRARWRRCTSTLDLDTPVERLGLGRQQLVEIAKALARDARVLVLDEPTAALTTRRGRALFEVLDRLRARGIGIVYVSHRLGEVFRMADRITVLRDGRSVGTADTAATRRGASGLADGRADGGHAVPAASPGARRRRARREASDAWRIRMRRAALATGEAAPRRRSPRRLLVDDVSFTVRAGEVLGIGGLIGAGRTELLLRCSAPHPDGARGTVIVAGAPVTIRSAGARRWRTVSRCSERIARASGCSPISR